MRALIKLLFSFIFNARNIAQFAGIQKILVKIAPLSELKRLDPRKLLSDLKAVRKLLNKSIATLERQIARNPLDVIKNIDKKLTQQEKNILSNYLSANNEGQQVFLSSSWIQWAIWVPVGESKTLGTLTIKIKGGSANNPSGVYTFPLHGHPHGYGQYVPRFVYDILRVSSSAGADFWLYFYRSWYNVHRRVNYLLPMHKKR